MATITLNRNNPAHREQLIELAKIWPKSPIRNGKPLSESIVPELEVPVPKEPTKDFQSELQEFLSRKKINKETEQAIQDTLADENLITYDSVEEIFEEVSSEPKKKRGRPKKVFNWDSLDNTAVEKELDEESVSYIIEEIKVIEFKDASDDFKKAYEETQPKRRGRPKKIVVMEELDC